MDSIQKHSSLFLSGLGSFFGVGGVSRTTPAGSCLLLVLLFVFSPYWGMASLRSQAGAEVRSREHYGLAITGDLFITGKTGFVNYGSEVHIKDANLHGDGQLLIPKNDSQQAEVSIIASCVATSSNAKWLSLKASPQWVARKYIQPQISPVRERCVVDFAEGTGPLGKKLPFETPYPNSGRAVFVLSGATSGGTFKLSFVEKSSEAIALAKGFLHTQRDKRTLYNKNKKNVHLTYFVGENTYRRPPPFFSISNLAISN